MHFRAVSLIFYCATIESRAWLILIMIILVTFPITVLILLRFFLSIPCLVPFPLRDSTLIVYKRIRSIEFDLYR